MVSYNCMALRHRNGTVIKDCYSCLQLYKNIDECIVQNKIKLQLSLPHTLADQVSSWSDAQKIDYHNVQGTTLRWRKSGASRRLPNQVEHYQLLQPHSSCTIPGTLFNRCITVCTNRKWGWKSDKPKAAAVVNSPPRGKQKFSWITRCWHGLDCHKTSFECLQFLGKLFLNLPVKSSSLY